MDSVMSLNQWIPTIDEFIDDVTIFKKVDMSGVNTTHWKDMPFWGEEFKEANVFFSGYEWAEWTYANWVIPLLATALYLVMIPTLKWYVKKYGKWNVRTFAFYWNAGLSLFSWMGVFATVPVLTATLWHNGFYFTCCAPALSYANGKTGLFVALFIYSKLAELIDTVLLILADKPVIALQWWHHSTVLLYCWHSYSVRIASGAWFACMNYSVHSVMYGYFAMTGTKYRKYCTPFAIYITLGQLLQMVVGIIVTVNAVMYQVAGQECYVNKTNSFLGLLMYASYFVLFLKLFIENYIITKKRESTKRTRASSITVLKNTGETVVRKMSMSVAIDDPVVDSNDSNPEMDHVSLKKHN